MSYQGPFNILDQRQLYGSKRKNLDADLHHNKQINLFFEQSSSSQRQAANLQNLNPQINNAHLGNNPHAATLNQNPSQSLLHSDNSFEGVVINGSSTLPRSVKQSPQVKKEKVVGQTKPNQLDPSKLPYDDGRIAGVETNYGTSPQLYKSDLNSLKPMRASVSPQDMLADTSIREATGSQLNYR